MKLKAKISLTPINIVLCIQYIINIPKLGHSLDQNKHICLIV